MSRTAVILSAAIALSTLTGAGPAPTTPKSTVAAPNTQQPLPRAPDAALGPSVRPELVEGPAKPVAPAQPATPPKADAPKTKPKLMYTTYFYTAGEAIIHGYEDHTQVRIVSLEKRGTIWEGEVAAGEVKLIPTGKGVFSFLADKKAGILVGTPSSCSVIGYFVKNENGVYRGKHFLAQLPATLYFSDERVLVWAYEDTFATVTDKTTGKTVKAAKIAAGKYLEINRQELGAINAHLLEVSTDGPEVGVQVYYDEGFIVPASNGRGAGSTFYAYVGTITTGQNDLVLIANTQDAKIKVTNVDTGARVWEGQVKQGGIEAITLAGVHVKVEADAYISVEVAPFKHYQAGYQEHHFATGLEGTGIENEFLTTTPGELWVFSYYANNPITVTDARTGAEVWKGALGAGAVAGLKPGYGFFKVRSEKGISVMGGEGTCGADYSPAGGMFAVDEALFEVVMQVREERIKHAEAQGKTLTADQLNAPLSAAEVKVAAEAVKQKTGRKDISAAEVQERAATMVAH